MKYAELVTTLGSPRFLRFCIVGLATALIYIALYYVFKQSFSAGPLAASGVAFFVAIVFQYLGHSKFTFRRSLTDKAQLMRFVATVSVGLTVSSVVTGVIWPALALPEFWSLVVVICVLPLVNFIIFSLWVFVSPAQKR